MLYFYHDEGVNSCDYEAPWFIIMLVLLLRLFVSFTHLLLVIFPANCILYLASFAKIDGLLAILEPLTMEVALPL